MLFFRGVVFVGGGEDVKSMTLLDLLFAVFFAGKLYIFVGGKGGAGSRGLGAGWGCGPESSLGRLLDGDSVSTASLLTDLS